MRTLKVLILAVALASLTACNGSGGNSDGARKTEAAPTQSAPSQPEKTYVPAPGDPKTHVLIITIRDKGLSYKPGTCIAKAGNSDFPDSMVLGGPDAESENSDFGTGEGTPIPRQGKPLADGTCEATMKVTVPYKPRYTAGIAREGNGIAGPEDAKETKFVTKGASQRVLVLNYPT